MAGMAKTRWCLSLLACPVAIVALWYVYYQPPDSENFLRAPPWPYYAISVLFLCQLGISLWAAVAIIRMVSGQHRLLAWIGVLLLLGFTALVAFGASVAVSGRYL